ncbi:MAG: hypothetical protein NVS4B3_24570 [Gemmatimonadaceae bacterium]
MRRSLLRAALSGVFSALAAFAGAAVYVGTRNGFRSANLATFGVWCAFLGVTVAVLPAIFVRAGLPTQRTLRGLYGIGVGLVVGIALTLAMWLALGQWIRAFGFPVLYLFAGGAATAVGLTFAATKPLAPPGASGLSLRRAITIFSGLLALVAITPLVLTFGTMYIWDRADPEVHLLPAGFLGPVVIIYGQPNGAPPRWEGKARLFVIPPTGVLRTQAPPNPGWSNPSYFYVSAAGTRSPIVRGLCDDPLPDGPVQACAMGVMYVDNLPRPEYSAYIVARRADISAQSERADSLVRAEVFGPLSRPRSSYRELGPGVPRVLLNASLRHLTYVIRRRGPRSYTRRPDSGRSDAICCGLCFCSGTRRAYWRARPNTVTPDPWGAHSCHGPHGAPADPPRSVTSRRNRRQPKAPLRERGFLIYHRPGAGSGP